MAETAVVAPGQDIAGNLPPLNLPSMDITPPSGPLRIRVAPDAPQPPADPWASVPTYDPEAAAPAPQAGPAGQPAGDPWAKIPTYDPDQEQQPAAAPGAPEPETPGPRFSGGTSALMGVLDAASMGLQPAAHGLSEASGLPAALDVIPAPIRPLVGSARLLGDYFGVHQDPSVREAYTRGREAAQQNMQAAQDQHQVAFLAGQLAGTLATTVAAPLGVAGRAAGTAGRIGQSALSGAVGTGLYDAGTAVSHGESAPEVAAAGAKGAVTGAIFGGGLGAGAEAIGQGARMATSAFRGVTDQGRDIEAARRVLHHQGVDRATRGGAPAIGPQEAQAAITAGTPVSIADFGGESSRALLRSSANTSPAGRQQVEDFVGPRFRSQGQRVADFVRNHLGGGGRVAQDTVALQDAARRANRPAYAAAYRAGDRPIWSPELERLMTSDAVPEAARAAAQRGRNRAVADGFGGFNPRVTVTPDGRILVSGRGGVPSYPNIQYWDYVQRELSDLEGKALRSGANEEANALGSLRRQLNAELDNLVPEFGAARGGAAGFFGAQDALEAGAKFVTWKDTPETVRALRRIMADPAQRELFARGFASELAKKIEAARDGVSVINAAFIQSPNARQKIFTALGPQRAQELEALLRVEAIVDRARQALGNSTTARQIFEHGLAGGVGAGAVGTYEAVQGQSFNPVELITGALMFTALRGAAQRIDERVARRVAEMLISQDPQVVRQGARAVVTDHRLLDALRTATGVTARVGAHRAGLGPTAAGIATGVQSLLPKPKTEHHGDQGDAILDQLPQQPQ